MGLVSEDTRIRGEDERKEDAGIHPRIPEHPRIGRELRKKDSLLLVCPEEVRISFRCANSTESMAFAGVRNAKTEMSSEGRWCVPTMPALRCGGMSVSVNV
jgi:hypothetical protein